MKWQPLSVREGRRATDGPYEGVPPHTAPRLLTWLTGLINELNRPHHPDVNLAVASAFRIPLAHDASGADIRNAILEVCEADEALFIDVIDAYLHRTPHLYKDDRKLQDILDDSGSAFMVRPDRNGLQRRVSEAAALAVGRAMSRPEVASEELKRAWARAFDVHPDPSYAWSHAVKAVEAVLIPLVVPKQDKPHLGHVLGVLHGQEDQFELALTPQQGISSIETLVAMLRLIYPNPDRHTGPNNRVPTLAEAQAVVHLAVTIVQWARDGVVSKRRASDDQATAQAEQPSTESA